MGSIRLFQLNLTIFFFKIKIEETQKLKPVPYI